jgi:glycosyltransferase involved in cell wall biosynthesis
MVSSGFYPILPHQRGAIEPYIYELSKHLAHTNYIDVFGIGSGDEKIGNLRIQTFPYGENVPNSLKNIIGPRLAYQIPFSTYLMKSIFRLHKKNPIDILHIHDIHSGFAATISKLALGIPYVCSIHNEIRTTLPIQTCDKALAVSEYIKHFLIEKRKISKSNVDILNVAININACTPARSVEQAKKELGLQNHRIVLFVGRKCPEKGPQVLLKALPKIVSYNPRVLAVLVGPDYNFFADSKSYTNFLAIKAEKLGVKSKVVFENFVSDDTLRVYYNAADVFVCPSIWQEPSATVVKEALSFKKPVVATNVGGTPDTIEHGYNGLLVPPNDPEALAEAVSLLLTNREYAEKLGENGRKVVEKKFSFEVVSKDCLKIYSKLI